jgi:hypothetical protein
LDKIKNHILAPNIILLENQPVLKNPTMKSMQMFLYSYYLIRHMDIGGLGNKNLQCYTASKKLDLINFLPSVEQIRINNIIAQVKSGYQKNKKMSILMVEYLLKSFKSNDKSNDKTNDWQLFFNNHNKQDDLADSLLMTLHYFEKSNLAKLKKDALKILNTKARANARASVNAKLKNKNKNKNNTNTDNADVDANAADVDANATDVDANGANVDVNVDANVDVIVDDDDNDIDDIDDLIDNALRI